MKKIISSKQDGMIATVVDVLNDGGVAICPTATNYNIICDARNPMAIRRIFSIKKRTKLGPLPICLSSHLLFDKYVSINRSFNRSIFEVLLPGEVSFIFPQKFKFDDQLTCGLKTLAVTSPSHPILQSLLVRFNGPIAASSANISGQGNIFVNFEKAINEIGNAVDIIIDDGRNEAEIMGHGARVNTIVDFTFEPPHLCREGWVPTEHLLQYIPDLVIDVETYKSKLLNRVKCVSKSYYVP